MPGGTAYITDLGMVGVQDSILGVRSDLVLKKFLSGMPVRFEMAEGAAEYAAVVVDIDDAHRRRTTMQRVLIRDEQPHT